LPFDVPASYWLDLKGYDPGREAAKLGKPFLVLQGGRDYQVTEQDFAGWKKALQGKSGATFKGFPALNHLFIAGAGRSEPSEYALAGHLDERVLDAIADWVKAAGAQFESQE